MRKLTLNKFPYYFEDGVKNFVLWYGNKNATKEEKEEWILQYKELEIYDLIVFENDPNLRSVRLIPHLQILARKVKAGKSRTILF